MTSSVMTWAIVVLATAGVIVRPFQLPEATWAVTGAAILVLSGLLPVADAWHGVAKGGDVYLFLVGMMLLAELAREQGLFDWLAAHAAKLARGSGTRLFTLVYLVGTVVTVFLSNDATAVVLTPAVAAVCTAAEVADPLPYLLVCAFIANAASFVLPISNPANLVIYGAHMPALLAWVERYSLASALSVAATYAVLRLTQRNVLSQTVATSIATPALGAGGRVAAAGIGLAAIVLMVASARDWPLGAPTCAAGVLTAIGVLACERKTPWRTLRGVSWSVLPLVAGLFVLVEALDRTGVLRLLASLLRQAVQQGQTQAAWGSGIVLALACNVMNNLPAGLIAGNAIQAAHAPPAVAGAVLIGVDLGPNLSVTGSLATILWLTALRREGLHVSAAAFLKIGALVMPPALLLALTGLLLPGALGF